VVGIPLTVGTGFTTIVAVVKLEHPSAVEAVMVNVDVCEVLVVLVKVPEIDDPVPTEEIPVRFVVLSLVQLRLVPGTLLGLKLRISVIVDPEQIV